MDPDDATGGADSGEATGMSPKGEARGGDDGGSGVAPGGSGSGSDGSPGAVAPGRPSFDPDVVRADVAAGLLRRSRSLPPKYFYDERGSALFDLITRIPEYYLTRAERMLLRAHAAGIVERAGHPATIVELGPGSAEKSRLLITQALRSVRRLVYSPVDVSEAYLGRLRTDLAADYQRLEVRAVKADFTRELSLPNGLPRPALHALLGSSIGNFPGREGERLVGRIRDRMRLGDTFLVGVDLHKESAVIEAAYNDAAGVTAAFNRNILRVVNDCLGSDFDPAAFDHLAFYDERRRRVEMRLVSRRDQRVSIPGVGDVRLRAGESILTEYSRKYVRSDVARLFRSAGLRLAEWYSDAGKRFALALSAPV